MSGTSQTSLTGATQAPATASTNMFCDTAQEAMRKARYILDRLNGKSKNSAPKAPEFAFYELVTLPGRNSPL
ncbi:hypothetical protein FAUST_6325 [Fusarium austroamericanum]|uniref:Uncharacterized protein n=1 Tax=Fusarium austroamericanum TaxID=282268 RepID=A0AAN5Z9K2_FUSAU|nr:hypothetical protein FAUST_6325 [Fusarium austroamericanum]